MSLECRITIIPHQNFWLHHLHCTQMDGAPTECQAESVSCDQGKQVLCSQRCVFLFWKTLLFILLVVILFIFIFCPCPQEVGFPDSSVGKESACNVGDLGSIPGLGRSPGEGKGYPLQLSGLEHSMDYIVHGVTKSQTQLSDFQSISYNHSMWNFSFPTRDGTRTSCIGNESESCSVMSLCKPILQADSLPAEPQGKPLHWKGRVLTTGPPGISQRFAF